MSIYDSAENIRKKALKMALHAGKAGSHVGGSFSCLEILAVLYGVVMNYDLNNKGWEERDRFIASKAHCILTHYATLAEFGFIDEEALDSFHENDGLLAGHPMGTDIGMEFSGGSLGMGISLGIGMAVAAVCRKQKQRIYVLLGDGECNEGEVWEAFMSASQFHLSNLTVIIDYNNMQFDGANEDVMSVMPLEDKLKAFGWTAVSCDGHNIEDLQKAFSTEHNGKPLAIIAHTIKANGIEKYENTPESHHCAISENDYAEALKWMEQNHDRV